MSAEETAKTISGAARWFACAATGSVDAREMTDREAASALMVAAAFMIARAVPSAEVESELTDLFEMLLTDLPGMLGAKARSRH